MRRASVINHQRRQAVKHLLNIDLIEPPNHNDERLSVLRNRQAGAGGKPGTTRSMFTSIARRTVARVASSSGHRSAAAIGGQHVYSVRHKSQAAAATVDDGTGNESDNPADEVIGFPSDEKGVEVPVLLNSKQHAVGYLSKVLNARVYEASIETELQHAKNLSSLLNNKVYLKREDTQPVFSFKIRGAYNKMAHLTREELDHGVVACSAGNHAQGVALSARKLGCRAVIVMPLATPSIKVNSVRVHGGLTVEVRLFGNNYDEAAAEAKRLNEEEGLAMIHPFDDPFVIAGQGTIGMEVLKERVSGPLDAIFVCCGGGGMLAGIAAYVKRVRPSVKVIGVEAADAAGMTASIREGKVVTLPTVGLFADGAAVKTIGSETFRVCNKLVDDMITVDTDQICNAIKLSYNDA